MPSLPSGLNIEFRNGRVTISAEISGDSDYDEPAPYAFRHAAYAFSVSAKHFVDRLQKYINEMEDGEEPADA